MDSGMYCIFFPNQCLGFVDGFSSVWDGVCLFCVRAREEKVRMEV